MELTFFDVFVSVIAMVLLAVPGFIFGKFKLLPENSAKTCSTIVLYCCQSVMVFMSFQSYSYSSKVGLNMLLTAGLAVLLHFIMIGLGYLLFRKKDSRAKVMRYAIVFGNCGFMGFPFLKMLFSGSTALNEILIYAAVFVAIFNILNWTMGVFIMTGDVKKISLKKIALNPVIISIIVGFLVFIILKQPIQSFFTEGTNGFKFVSKIMASLTLISDMVTPLSMFVIGLSLASVNMKELFLDAKAYLACLLKLVGAPIIAILVVAFLPISLEVKCTLFLLFAMPSATSTTLFSVNFGGDSKFSSVCVLLSVILCIITIPLIYLAFTGIISLV